MDLVCKIQLGSLEPLQKALPNGPTQGTQPEVYEV